MPRHHLVPQFLLRNFADTNEKLVMVSRRPPHDSRLVAVTKACAERAFYTIETEDLQEGHSAGHDPELVEKVLANLEADTAEIIRTVIAGGFPLPPEQRFRLSLFVALQMTRGWRFREDMNELGTFAMRQCVEMLPLDRFRDWLREKGDPFDNGAVTAFRESALGVNSPRLVMTQPFAVQQSLRFAVKDFITYIYMRTWQLLRFSQDLLLISDNPVGMWNPVPVRPDFPMGQDFSVGVANARLICLPLNRRTALVMIPRIGEDYSVDGGIVRARQINMAVIQDAERWIFHHPSDDPLNGVVIPQPAAFTDETIAVRSEAGGIRRELHRVVKRIPTAPVG